MAGVVPVGGVAVGLQIGVVPLQSPLVTQPTHWPAMVPAVAQTGVVPVHGPVAAPASRVPLSRVPPSEEPLLTGPLAEAPGALQPWHWF